MYKRGVWLAASRRRDVHFSAPQAVGWGLCAENQAIPIVGIEAKLETRTDVRHHNSHHIAGQRSKATDALHWARQSTERGLLTSNTRVASVVFSSAFMRSTITAIKPVLEVGK